MSTQKIQSMLRSYIFLLIFVSCGLTLMTMSGKAIKLIKSSDNKPTVSIEQPIEIPYIEYHPFPEINFVYKILNY